MLESKSKVLTSTLKSRYFRHESNVVHGPDTAEGEKVKMQNEQISLFRVAIVAGFEPARAMPIGFQVQRLNHSAILPEKNCCPDRTGDPKIKKKTNRVCQRRGSNPRGRSQPEVLKTSPLDLSGTLAVGVSVHARGP